MQVGDRRLTVGEDVWDPAANKSLVIAPTNGLMMLSYSGVAYIDGIPTDNWLAGKLTGQAIGDQAVFSERTPMKSGTFPTRKLPEIVAALLAALNELPGPLTPSHRLSVLMNGLTWKRRRSFGIGRCRYFMMIVEQDATPGQSRIIYERWQYEGIYHGHFQAIGATKGFVAGPLQELQKDLSGSSYLRWGERHAVTG